jgi:transposase
VPSTADTFGQPATGTVPRDSTGLGGPSLLAMILFEKFGQHQPLNRQAERYAREGVPLSLSTLANQVGACTAVLMPLFYPLQAQIVAAGRLHGDDSTVPVLARGKTDIARLWTYVRRDQPFGGPALPAAVFHYSRDRGGEHPRANWRGMPGCCRPTPMPATASSTSPDGKPGPILEAACWAHYPEPIFMRSI